MHKRSGQSVLGTQALLWRTLAAAAILWASACAPTPEEVAATQQATQEHEPTHCERQRAIARSGAPSAGGDAEAVSAISYDRACAVFVSARDEQLRNLVIHYLDVVQRDRGGGMVRTLDYDDGIVAIREAATEVFERRLAGGTTYRFIGACDNECADIDVTLKDASGTTLDSDAALDNTPVVTFTPEVDGVYQVELRMYRCSIEPCYAGLRVLEARQDWALEPTFGSVTLHSGAFADPYQIQVISGGNIDMARRQSNCAGFVAVNPDVRVVFTAGENHLPLIFSVNSEADTTLVINGPDALWSCDDDGGVLGRNPMVMFSNPQSGQYDIWIGTFGGAQTHPARLAVSEQASQ